MLGRVSQAGKGAGRTRLLEATDGLVQILATVRLDLLPAVAVCALQLTPHAHAEHLVASPSKTGPWGGMG